MKNWIKNYHLLDNTGRNVCTVYYDKEAECWDFVDCNDYCDGGFETAEQAIAYYNEYVRNQYGIS